jgi:hypothetical protein
LIAKTSATLPNEVQSVRDSAKYKGKTGLDWEEKRMKKAEQAQKRPLFVLLWAGGFRPCACTVRAIAKRRALSLSQLPVSRLP